MDRAVAAGVAAQAAEQAREAWAAAEAAEVRLAEAEAAARRAGVLAGGREPGPEQRAGPAPARRWERVVRRCFRIRRLQRIWHHLGEYLKTVPPGVRCLGRGRQGHGGGQAGHDRA